MSYFTSQSNTQRVAVGPLEFEKVFDLITYDVVEINSDHALNDKIPEGVPVTFTAKTEPAGYEPFVNWLAVTKYGSAKPTLGQGSVFTTTFENTFGAGINETIFQWIGIRAANQRFGQDNSRARDCFESKRRGTITFDVDDKDCSNGIDLDLTSEGLSDSIVELDPRPYGTGVDINTELVQLELKSGDVTIRVRDDRNSFGMITNIVADSNGEFVSGDSSFDIFVEVEIPGMGTLDTGNESLRLEVEEITALPPLNKDYVPPPSTPQILPLFDSTGTQVGWLCHAEHTPTRGKPCP